MIIHERYLTFDAEASRKIDQIILNTIPNNLDIVKKKILNNYNITKAAQYVFVISNNEKIGLNTYCRSRKIPYNKAKAITNANNLSEIKESILLELIGNEEIQYEI